LSSSNVFPDLSLSPLPEILRPDCLVQCFRCYFETTSNAFSEALTEPFFVSFASFLRMFLPPQFCSVLLPSCALLLRPWCDSSFFLACARTNNPPSVLYQHRSSRLIGQIQRPTGPGPFFFHCPASSFCRFLRSPQPCFSRFFRCITSFV